MHGTESEWQGEVLAGHLGKLAENLYTLTLETSKLSTTLKKAILAHCSLRVACATVAPPMTTASVKAPVLVYFATMPSISFSPHYTPTRFTTAKQDAFGAD